MPEHSLQNQIADALRLEIAPPGQLSRDGVVWWSGSTTPAMRALHLALASGVALSRFCRTCYRQQLAIRQSQECNPIVFKRCSLAHAHLLVGT